MTLKNYSAGKDNKHLLWTIDEDDMLECNTVIVFLEWGIAFLRKYSDV